MTEREQEEIRQKIWQWCEQTWGPEPLPSAELDGPDDVTERERQTLLLAEKVMLWVQEHSIAGVTRLVRPDACSIVIWKNAPGGDGTSWNPFVSIADAWMLVDALRERGLWFKLVTPWSAKDIDYSAGFTEFETVDCGSSWVRGRAPTVCGAICAAALKALEDLS